MISRNLVISEPIADQLFKTMQVCAEGLSNVCKLLEELKIESTTKLNQSNDDVEMNEQIKKPISDFYTFVLTNKGQKIRFLHKDVMTIGYVADVMDTYFTTRRCSTDVRVNQEVVFFQDCNNHSGYSIVDDNEESYALQFRHITQASMKLLELTNSLIGPSTLFQFVHFRTVQEVYTMMQDLQKNLDVEIRSYTDKQKVMCVLNAASELCKRVKALSSCTPEILQTAQKILDYCVWAGVYWRQTVKLTQIIIKAPEDLIEAANISQKNDKPFEALKHLTNALKVHQKTDKIGHQFKHSWSNEFMLAHQKCLCIINKQFNVDVGSSKGFENLLTKYHQEYQPVFDEMLRECMQMKDNRWAMIDLAKCGACFHFNESLIAIATPQISRDNMVLLKSLIKTQSTVLHEMFAKYADTVLNIVSKGLQDVNQDLYFRFDIIQKNPLVCNFEFNDNTITSNKTLGIDEFFKMVKELHNSFKMSNEVIESIQRQFSAHFGQPLLYYYNQGNAEEQEMCKKLLEAFTKF